MVILSSHLDLLVLTSLLLVMYSNDRTGHNRYTPVAIAPSYKATYI